MIQPGYRRPARYEAIMTKLAEPTVIESTAGQVAAELKRRGIRSEQRVTVTIEPDEPDDWIAKARRFARPKILAEGWSDDDIDRLIKQAQEDLKSNRE
jgi:hypothetical protein